MADWWYTKNGERQGPVSSSQLRQLAQAGELLPTDMVFKEGGTEWKLATSVSNLFPSSGGGSGFRAERPAREERDRGGMDFDERDERDDDNRPSKRGGPESPGTLKDLLMFRRMVAPTLILILFYLAVAGAILGGLIGAVMALVQFSKVSMALALVLALLFLIAIPIYILFYRLVSEVMIVIFRIHETLTDIKSVLEKDQRPKS
jgi:hypothetical protein